MSVLLYAITSNLILATKKSSWDESCKCTKTRVFIKPIPRSG